MNFLHSRHFCVSVGRTSNMVELHEHCLLYFVCTGTTGNGSILRVKIQECGHVYLKSYEGLYVGLYVGIV